MTLRMAIFFCLLCTAFTSSVHAQTAKNFDKASFYKVLSGNDVDAVDNELALLKNTSVQDRDAFEGALLMKKAGLIAGLKKKLDTFKQGHKLLEAVIEKDKTNAELRFLRLIIQENAPKVLGYNKNKDEDVKLIKESYKKLPEAIQNAIVDYSKKSKLLTPSDF